MNGERTYKTFECKPFGAVNKKKLLNEKFMHFFWSNKFLIIKAVFLWCKTCINDNQITFEINKYFSGL